jgi:type II secretion system protein G
MFINNMRKNINKGISTPSVPKQKSFTLIELLLVISVIGLLSSVILTSLVSSLEKARDTKRKTELSQLAKALEMYWSANNGKYPQETQVYDTSIGCGSSLPSGTNWCDNDLKKVLVPNYISKLPLDPKNGTDHYYYFEPYDPNDPNDYDNYFQEFNENNYEICFQGESNEGYCSFWKLCANELERTGEKYCVYSLNSGETSYSTLRTLTLGSGTFTLNGTGATTKWNCTTSTNLTITPSTGTIVLTNSGTSAQSFAGGAKAYNNVQITGAGNYTLTITGSNTFNELKIDTPPKAVYFTAGTTQTITMFTATGSTGNLITIGSPTAASHTLTKTGGGIISSDYLSISYSTATPSNTWYAGANSTNGGNNIGWIFTAPP